MYLIKNEIKEAVVWGVSVIISNYLSGNIYRECLYKMTWAVKTIFRDYEKTEEFMFWLVYERAVRWMLI